MALIKCKECGQQVSNKAKICPHCGAMVKRVGWGIKTIIVCIIVFAGVYLLGVVGIGLYLGDLGWPFHSLRYSQTPRYSQKYITKREYDQIEHGMTYTEVVKILGKESSVVSTSSGFDGDTTVIYTWINLDGSIVSVIMQNGRVIMKSQVD